MSPTIKITYFDFRGLAETMRLLLKYGEIDFEDNRISSEEWTNLKENTPFGQMPLYEEDGRVMWQSGAIYRYLGKKVKLAGANDWEDLEIDAIADTITDFRIKLAAFMTEKDEGKQKQLKETLINETGPFYLSRLDKIAEENDGHFVGKKLTWVDVYFSTMFLATSVLLGADATSKYPNLTAVNENVENIPAIKKWIETRPKTIY